MFQLFSIIFWIVGICGVIAGVSLAFVIVKVLCGYLSVSNKYQIYIFLIAIVLGALIGWQIIFIGLDALIDWQARHG